MCYAFLRRGFLQKEQQQAIFLEMSDVTADLEKKTVIQS